MKPDEKEHLWNEYRRLLPELIEEFGIANVVGQISNEVDDMLVLDENPDLELAAQVLEIACAGTDLCYDVYNRNSQVVRENAIYQVKGLVEDL